VCTDQVYIILCRKLKDWLRGRNPNVAFLAEGEKELGKIQRRNLGKKPLSLPLSPTKSEDQPTPKAVHFCLKEWITARIT
jgi:hypothetical protein